MEELFNIEFDLSDELFIAASPQRSFYDDVDESEKIEGSGFSQPTFYPFAD